MTITLTLPSAPGKTAPYTLKQPKAFPAAQNLQNGPPFSRIAFGAAHVVADPLADHDPWLKPAIDWDRTIAFRRHLWSLGLGVAEAMDTAQRGMGLDWKDALELVRHSLDAAKDVRSEEHTSELQSLMRISYADFCLKK